MGMKSSEKIAHLALGVSLAAAHTHPIVMDCIVDVILGGSRGTYRILELKIQ